MADASLLTRLRGGGTNNRDRSSLHQSATTTAPTAPTAALTLFGPQQRNEGVFVKEEILHLLEMKVQDGGPAGRPAVSPFH